MNLLIQIILYAAIGVAPRTDSIHFATEKTWEQIKVEAKREGKYIFVDCYATWCGPCKKMDKEVYTDPVVGNFINAHFISVKVQMDTSKLDGVFTKSWYPEARELQTRYGVYAFPTYLFFSPDGQIVHKDIGAKSPVDFLAAARDALVREKQYYVELRSFEDGALPYFRLPRLARAARSLGDKSVALKIADRYIHGYLCTLAEDSLLTRDNLAFVALFYQTIDSRDAIFKVVLDHPENVDSIAGSKGYARRLADFVITKEEIRPRIDTALAHNRRPDWALIYDRIKNRYGEEAAKRNVVNAQPGYYKRVGDWKNYTKCLVKQVQEYGMRDLRPGIFGAFYLNNSAWYVFEHSDDRRELETALQWSDKAIEMDSANLVFNDMDTKANILYKLGRTKEAIVLEEDVIQRDEEQAKIRRRRPLPVYRQTLARMKGQGLKVGEKPVIDSNAIKKWVSIGKKAAITNDGSYILYFIMNKPTGGVTMAVKSTKNEWAREYPGIGDAFFSGNGKTLVFRSHDTIHLVALGTDREITVSGVISFQANRSGNKRWIAFKRTADSEGLVIEDLYTGVVKTMASVANYAFGRSGSVLVMEMAIGSSKQSVRALLWYDLGTGKSRTIWRSEDNPDLDMEPDEFAFDKDDRQLAFLVKGKNLEKSVRSVWYYRAGTAAAIQRVDDRSPGMDRGYFASGPLHFSEGGQWILFNLQQRPVAVPGQENGAVDVDIWSYKDEILRPEQLRQAKENAAKLFTAAVNRDSITVVRLQQDDERVYSNTIPDDYVCVLGRKKEPWWTLSPQPNMYLESLRDGTRRLVKTGTDDIANFGLSPGGNYLLYYDCSKRAYCSFDVHSGVTRNLTGTLNGNFGSDDSSIVYGKFLVPVLGWLSGDAAVFVSDNYDIWQLDPSGGNPPVNVTGGYGLRNKIKLDPVDDEQGLGSHTIFRMGQDVLLSAFSPATKYNGFCMLKIGEQKIPELLTMGPYTYYRTESQAWGYSYDKGMRPLKAANTNTWLVTRQSETESPNYYTTTDFKTFQQLTNVAPQKEFNWLTDELVTWKQLDGSLSQGILYKPENFDSTRKYPVILNYYRLLSHRLHEFPVPGFCEDNIDIPWFVSRGYLVFTPDIHFYVATTSGKTTGESAYNSIVSAAEYLTALPYVDGKRMAIQGHSFGGGTTNYLVAHTGIFAAAAEAAGDADLVSAYLTLIPMSAPEEHFSKENIFESSYGATPWERPDLYRRGSVVLDADKISTPLLIMHNEKDNSVQWRQGMELFMAMRRLGKKVWLLQYDNCGHTVHGPEAVDYTFRLTQFFDYYLKGALPPRWMTTGMPARLKGIERGLDLDTTNRQP